LYKKAKGIYHW